METKIKSNNGILNKTGNNNGNDKRINNLPVSTAFNEVKKDEPKADVKPEAVKAETPKAEEVKQDGETKPQAEQNKPEPSKAEVKEQLAQQKPALNLEETLKLVAELAKKTALRDRYKENIESLEKFEELQKEEVDELEDETAFQQCELIIINHKGGFRFSTKSPSVIKGTVGFIGGRFAERMAEVEAEIVIPV